MTKKGRMKCVGLVTSMREKRSTVRILMSKHEERRPLGRLGHRWEGNIKMDFKELWCEGVDWIHVAQTRDQ
jgi:hypothetical protein